MLKLFFSRVGAISGKSQLVRMGDFPKMSNEVHDRELTVNQERISRLTPAQREMLQKRLRGEGPRRESQSAIKRRPTLDYPITAEQEHLWLLHQMEGPAVQ